MIDPANPFSAQANLHHTRSGYQSDEELYDDLFGRGAGDPDHYGYPGEPELAPRPMVDEKVADGEVSL